MAKQVKITADPSQRVGMAVGQGFIAFDGIHDIATATRTKKRRFIINLSHDDILWAIEALAKELPDVLHDEAVARIENLVR